MYKVYVDGSYNAKKHMIGWGYAIISEQGKMVYSSNGSTIDATLESMNNVGGELLATVNAVEYCYNNNIKDVSIHYDYKGIEDWVTGSWRAKNSNTRTYKEIMEVFMSVMHISFVKVKAHSGDRFNDVVDSLAKSACGIL